MSPTRVVPPPPALCPPPAVRSGAPVSDAPAPLAAPVNAPVNLPAPVDMALQATAAVPVPVPPVSRRDFLRRTGVSAVGAVAGGIGGAAIASGAAVAALPGLGLASPLRRPAGRPVDETAGDGQGIREVPACDRFRRDPVTGLPQRRLGRTGLWVVPVGVGGGAMNAGRQGLLEGALRAGLNLWDLSPAYGEGAAEETAGRVLSAAGSSARDRIVLMTKEPGIDLARLAGADGPCGPGSRASVSCLSDGVVERLLTASVEASLRRLRTDRIDVLVCPAAGATAGEFAGPLLPQLARAMERLRAAGKVLHFGAATRDVAGAPLAAAAIRSGLYDVVLTTLNVATLDDAGEVRRLLNEVQSRRNRVLAGDAKGRIPGRDAAGRITTGAADGRAVPSSPHGSSPTGGSGRAPLEAPVADDASGLPALAAARDVALVGFRAAHARFLPAELDALIRRRFGAPGLSRHQALYRAALFAGHPAECCPTLRPASQPADPARPAVASPPAAPERPLPAAVLTGLVEPAHLAEAVALAASIGW